MTKAKSEFRHDLTTEQRRMTDKQLAATLADGTGVSVAKFGYWDVVLRSDGQYIVTDDSRQGQKPLKVHGPVKTRQEAVDWARLTANLWTGIRVHTPSTPWE